jgi:hypothetical protein
MLVRLVRERHVHVVHGYEWPPVIDALFGPGLQLSTPVVGTVMSVAPFFPPHGTASGRHRADPGSCPRTTLHSKPPAGRRKLRHFAVSKRQSRSNRHVLPNPASVYDI